MAKHNNPISTKSLPKDARRVTLPDGRRAWIIAGKEYASKREYLDSLKSEKDKVNA
jgi:hypothetical protein